MGGEMPGKVSRECMERLGLVRFSKWIDFWDSELIACPDTIDSGSKLSVNPSTGAVFIEDSSEHMNWICTVNSDEELTVVMLALKRVPESAKQGLELRIVEERT